MKFKFVKKNKVFWWVFFTQALTCFSLFSQTNLVPNSSFEQYTNCPRYSNLDINIQKNNTPDIWYKPDFKGASYLNSCTNNDTLGVPLNQSSPTGEQCYQLAKNGNAYIAMFYYNGSNSRNYFQIVLTDTLQSNKCYYSECYIARINGYQLACNNQSILLTNSAIYADTAANPPKQIIPANPQVINTTSVISDTLNWVKVAGVFTGQGGEKFLTLGNFKDNNNTTISVVQSTGYYGVAYYVDDVSVYSLDSFQVKADAGPDTTIALGGSAFIGSLISGIPSIKWYKSNGVLFQTGVPGFTISPTQTDFYVIEQTVCGFTSRDTVYVSVNPLPLKWLNFTTSVLPPSAFGEGLVVRLKWQTANEENVSHFNIQRSYRGTNEFENVGQVSANNRLRNEYSFIDDKLNGTAPWALYRVQSIDKDGMRSYSEVRRMVFDQPTSPLTIFPNPAKNRVNFSCKNMRQIDVVDATGRTVLSQKVNGLSVVALNIASLSKGVYLVRVMSDESCEAQKLVVD